MGFGADAYWRTYRRREYDERRGGGRLRLSPRFGRDWRTGISIRGEDVEISDLDSPLSDRAPDYLAFEGHTTITSVGADIGYRKVDNPLIPANGFDVSASWESYGVLGGPPFQKLTTSFNGFIPLYRDLTDRPTVLELRLDAGYLYEDAPFFERFFAGGFGSVRGFRYRGISPRQGLDDDPVGGDFMMTGSLNLGFPLYGQSVRGVIFSDFGTVESDLEFGTIRTSAGFGFRFSFEGLGSIPIALDFGFPLNERPEDDEQIFSFSLGFIP
jgi:outer membrane protein insertion porin family